MLDVWFELFACPRCHGALESEGAGARCARCATSYPVVGGVPCLVEDPLLWRALWRSRLEDYLSRVARRLTGFTEEAALPNLLDCTRARIQRVHDAALGDARTLLGLYRDLLAEDDRTAPIIPGASARSDAPEVGYSEHLFRDFVWGKRETELALDLVRRLAIGPLGATAIYGVGTGRLALDVQRELGPDKTFGFDLQPLPLLVTSRLLAGEPVELHEYPLDPNSADVAVIRRRLELPFPKPEGVAFAFADALRPPLRPASLDTVITPWFIDVARADVREIAAAVSRVLRPGGVWLNFGPLRFQGALSRRYAIEEVHEIVALSAFELERRFHEDVPYFHAPESGNHRTDRVFSFAARKVGDAPALALPPSPSPWLSDTSLPIPVRPEHEELRKSSVFTLGVLSMIDGTRSAADIAALLAKQWGLPAEAVLAKLRPFLSSLP